METSHHAAEAAPRAATVPEVRTFRGRSVDEILPQVRTELGPDAIVLRRREGLAGGVGGFFQRPFAEVDARRPLPDELEPGSEGPVRNDRATEEGLASPAIQALVEQASPFADVLARVPAGLYGPQPAPVEEEPAIVFETLSLDAVEEPVAEALVEPADEPAWEEPLAVLEPAALEPPPVPVPSAIEATSPPPAPEPPAAPRGAPADVVVAVQRLQVGGLSAGFAADVVDEVVAHGLPFAPPDAFEDLVRTALARRLPVMAGLGRGPRTVALVGAGGAGKSLAVAGLAAAYAGAAVDVAVVALRSPDGGRTLRTRLEPLGVTVIAAEDAEAAARRLADLQPALAVVDTPAAGPGDPEAIGRLTVDLRALAAGEVHLALPATLSAAAGGELAEALAPLGVTHVALTHADQTSRPGSAVEVAVAAGAPLSYTCSRDGVAPVDPTDLARRLLP